MGKKKTNKAQEEVQNVGVMEEDLETASYQDEEESAHQGSLKEEMGTLILRMFSKCEHTGKIITRLKRKVYFPTDASLKPGWYVATIVTAKEKWGLMDTVPLDQVDYLLWDPKVIKGIFLRRNYQTGMLEVYPAVPKEQLETGEVESIKIHEVPIPKEELAEQSKPTMTIGEIIAAKRAERMAS